LNLRDTLEIPAPELVKVGAGELVETLYGNGNPLPRLDEPGDVDGASGEEGGVRQVVALVAHQTEIGGPRDLTRVEPREGLSAYEVARGRVWGLARRSRAAHCQQLVPVVVDERSRRLRAVVRHEPV